LTRAYGTVVSFSRMVLNPSNRRFPATLAEKNGLGGSARSGTA
jgi:hypothetical protein